MNLNFYSSSENVERLIISAMQLTCPDVGSKRADLFSPGWCLTVYLEPLIIYINSQHDHLLPQRLKATALSSFHLKISALCSLDYIYMD